MDLFYAHPEDVSERTITLRDEEAKHLSRVLRKQPGDSVLVTNGEDVTFEARIKDLDRSECHCEIERIIEKHNEPPVEVTLALSLLKSQSRFEIALEKSTEQLVPTNHARSIMTEDRMTS